MSKIKQVIEVRFNKGGKTYHYNVIDHYSYQPGDHVVVDSPYDGLTVVEVVNVNVDRDLNKANKAVVCKVHRGRYDEYLEDQEKRKEIIAELTKIEKEVEERQKWEFLANYSPQAKRLIDRLKKLG